MSHDYVARPDGFRTQGFIGDERIDGIPCAICGQFESQHVVEPEPVEEPPAKVAEEPKRKRAVKKPAAKKTTAKKPAAKKSSAKSATQKKTTTRRTKK